MVLVWFSPILYILGLIRRLHKCSPFTLVRNNTEDFIKRIGTYYMCIDDLML